MRRHSHTHTPKRQLTMYVLSASTAVFDLKREGWMLHERTSTSTHSPLGLPHAETNAQFVMDNTASVCVWLNFLSDFLPITDTHTVGCRRMHANPVTQTHARTHLTEQQLGGGGWKSAGKTSQHVRPKNIMHWEVLCA